MLLHSGVLGENVPHHFLNKNICIEEVVSSYIAFFFSVSLSLHVIIKSHAALNAKQQWNQIAAKWHIFLSPNSDLPTWFTKSFEVEIRS